MINLPFPTGSYKLVGHCVKIIQIIQSSESAKHCYIHVPATLSHQMLAVYIVTLGSTEGRSIVR